MSITDHSEPPFGAPRRFRPENPGDTTSERIAYLRNQPEPPPPPDPVANDILAQLRDIAAQQGFKLVPADDEQAEPTDIQYVARNIDRLRHLDLREVATGMFGDAMPKDVNEAIEKMAEWAAANKSKVQA